MNVVILWHMHQPYYVNPVTKMAMMPWVRLHSVKGYLDMIDLVSRTPEVKVNFNFTPVLVKQIEEFVTGEVKDLWEQWSRQPANQLDEQQRKGMLENFFKVNWDNLIKPHPRYWELLQKRGQNWDLAKIDDLMKVFTHQDYRDLQTWYNLAWCGYSAEARYPVLTELKKKGGDYTEAEKNTVLDIHQEIIRQILPLYRAASERGQIEITTTPFFHPIMPLVYDTTLAKRCMPHATFPPQFSAPEDVRAQLRLAQEQHKRVFGRTARGLWPSEGSVAPELIPLFQEAGIEYFCTDEGNLFRSLEIDPLWRGQRIDHLELFQGWRITHEGAQVNALFRERPLSDFIGFSASQNDYSHSANHLLHNLEHLSSVITTDSGCVCLALDGENAWESFTDGGEKFLSLVYQGIASRPQLQSHRLGDFFDRHPPHAEISRLHTGSWINSDFDIWIGDPEENKAWEWLGIARDFLVQKMENPQYTPEIIKAAWWEIYAAEGSDWFWWYGPDFTTDCDFLFDELFRTHLKNVYLLLGTEPPIHLDIPICLPSQSIHYTLPRRHIHPPITGRLENFFDWVGGGELDLKQQQTAMFKSDKLGQRVFYGFNEKYFYLRIDLKGKPDVVQLHFLSQPMRISATSLEKGGWEIILEHTTDPANPVKVSTNTIAAWKYFFVMAIPIKELSWKIGSSVDFFVVILENGLKLERYPERGAIEFPSPAPDFEASQWFV